MVEIKITLDTISPTKKKFKVEISPDLVSSEIRKAYNDLGKTAKLKGFRPGKIPINVLKRFFSEQIQTEVTSKLIKESFTKALEEHHLTFLSVPVFDKGDKGPLEEGKKFDYTAEFEVKPEIEVKDYEGIELKREKDVVSDELVWKRIEELRDHNAPLKTIDDREAKEGDIVTIDYESFLEEKKPKHIREKDVSFPLGSGKLMDEFEKNLLGMKLNEEKEFEIKYPETHSDKLLAGKYVRFKIKLNGIKEKVLPELDDEFAKDLGDYESFKELWKKVKEDCLREEEKNIRDRLVEDLMDKIIEKNPFEVPESLVKNQLQYLILEYSQNPRINPEEKISLADLTKRAIKLVRADLILEKVAEKEWILAEDKDVEQELERISEETQQSLDRIRAVYMEPNRLENLKAQLLREKTINFLLSKVNIIEKEESREPDSYSNRTGQ